MFAAVVVEERSGIVRYLRLTLTRSEAEEVLALWVAGERLDADDDPPDRESVINAYVELAASSWRLRLNGMDLAQVLECDE